MTLKAKLYSVSFILHASLFSLALFFYKELGMLLLGVEALLVISLIIFLKLIKKGLQPLEYIHTFSSLLKEQEFTARFSHLNQRDLDQLIDQFNQMLHRLHKERLEIGEQKGVFEKLMAESPIGVVLLDFEKRISDLNPAAENLLNVDKAVVCSKNLNQLSASDVKYLKDVKVNNHQLVIAEQGRRLKIGHYDIHDRGFDRSFYMIYEMTGDIIQSQKSAYEKLIRLMSHEVNNTIASTNSLLESCLTFKDQLDDDAKLDFQNAINIVINRCGSLNHFMQGYSDIVKLEKPIKTEFNLTKLINDLTILFYADCEKRSIQISFEQSEAITIKADANLIEQALINVIKNAIEAIDNNGEILIVLKKDKNGVQLKISDSGCGISAEAEAQLFTPFYTSKESGQGVGLMLIREILNLHSYQFNLSNNKDKQGATFTLNVPC